MPIERSPVHKAHDLEANKPAPVAEGDFHSLLGNPESVAIGAAKPSQFSQSENYYPKLEQLVTPIGDNVTEKPPTARLAWVTRISNEIDKMLQGEYPDLQKIRFSYTDYLEKVSLLYNECPVNHNQWLEPHRVKINLFRERIDKILYPQATTSGILNFPSSSGVNKAKSVISNCSSTSSVKAALAIQKAKLRARKETSEKTYDLEKEEMMMKLEIKRKKEQLKQEELAKEVSYLESALEQENEIDECCSQSSSSERSKNSRHEALRADNDYRVSDGILDVLRKQNDITESMLFNQRILTLPKKELTIFDGSNILKYKSFIMNFEKIVEEVCTDDYDRMHYLKQYTAGRAKQLVDSCSHYNSTAAFNKAKQLLDAEYGNEYKVSVAYKEILDAWPPIKTDDGIALHDLSIFLQDCNNYMDNSSHRNLLQSPHELLNVVNKLPYKMREKWRRTSYNLTKNYGGVFLRDLASFITEEAAVLRQPIFGIVEEKKEKSTIKVQSSRSKALITQTSDEVKAVKNSKFCYYCDRDNHYISYCIFFKKITLDERKDFVKKKKLCFSCLQKNHSAKNCPKPFKCFVCSAKHPTVLHPKPEMSETSSENELEHPQCGESKNCYVSSNKNKIICPILPIRLRHQNKDFIINCALDTCSTDCWISENLLQKIGIDPPETSVNLATMDGRKESLIRVVNNLHVSNMGSSFEAIIPVVFTKPQSCWPFTLEDVVKDSDTVKYPHLKTVPFSYLDSNVEMLIGMNQPNLLKPLEVVEGEEDDPFATRYHLGWALNGPIKRSGNEHICNRIANHKNLDELIDNYYSREFVEKSNDKDLSYSDKKWLATAQQNIRLKSDHYEIDLPIKEDYYFSNNKQQIYKRFLGLIKRLNNNADLYNDYDKFMKEMFDQDFAEIIPLNEIDCHTDKVYYINHHAVYHKQKKKIRIVFNCSLVIDGVSLNGNLLQGPDLTSSLFGVLLRFRQEQVAVTADITKMFYQVRVPKEDRDLLRFFWIDSNKKHIECRLKVHLFGATSSPSIANFALQQTALGSECSSQAKDTIMNNFYVDDLLKSVNDVYNATALIQEVKRVIAVGGFKLTDFKSNSLVVMNSLNSVKENNVFDEINVISNYDLCVHTDSRTLGVNWKTETDELGFNIKFLDSVDCSLITKRFMLQILASVYDPLGLATPTIINAKKLFQEACKLKLDWDTAVPPHLQRSWTKWMSEISNLKDYKIDRCLKLPEEIGSVQLHLFCDGSEQAYGSVAYIKFVYTSGNSNVSLLASKSRLTPINNSTLKTVPRIELCSAKLGVELSQKLIKELEFKIDTIMYWSDSTIVLSYIKNEDSRFQRFVSNKVSFIRSFSEPNQWYYVDTHDNPADIISRGANPLQLSRSSLWNKGPEFLSSNEYPVQDCEYSINDSDREIKKLNLRIKKEEQSPLDIIMESSKNWYGLKLRISWLIRLKNALRSRTSLRTDSTSVSELCGAEDAIIKYLQNKYYENEIKKSKLNENLNINSPLRKLNPFLDNKGILRVGGRIQDSVSCFDIKHPIILPNCKVTQLIMYEAHARVGHMGRNFTLNYLRQKYWIVKANSMARKVINSCFLCKRLHGKTGEQIMSNLPDRRVIGDNPPFTHTGVDCFGPFYVTQGRKQVKRYGVIFSCMSSRAIHIEICHSLDTDSFINAIRRFICRRGDVKSFTSDNGTNMVGANSELKENINSWNQTIVNDWMKQRAIEWHFITPLSSHHGGFYEREIRSIRQIFEAIMQEQNVKLNDEELVTLMCEAEAILNNRPLTELNQDPTDDEALTPNHLLLFRNIVTFPPGCFVSKDLYVRRRWKQVQYLSDLFWKRWHKQYLVLLQERSKWFNVKDDFSIGDLVLVKDVNLPRNNWPLGRIMSVKRSGDNHIRTANIKVSKCRNGNIKDFQTTFIDRPIVKLIKLRSLPE